MPKLLVSREEQHGIRFLVLPHPSGEAGKELPFLFQCLGVYVVISIVVLGVLK